MNRAWHGQAAPRERLRRWVRVHVTHTQARDLFYPCAERLEVGSAGAALDLAGVTSGPGEAWVNGRRARLEGFTPIPDGMRATLSPASLVLPGENVVSLPAGLNARGVRLYGAQRGAIGWGSVQGPFLDAPDARIGAAAAFLRRSLSRDPFGEGIGSLTAWDRQAGCERLWSWYWTTGIVYEALAHLADAGYEQPALDVIEAGLAGRQCREDGDAHGSYMVRWDPDRTRPEGIQAWHAPNDAAYLGLHGLLVAHRRHGDARWLERALDLARWIREHGTRDGRLRVGWNAVTGTWDDSWHYIDAAWTPAFFVELAARTGDASHLAFAADLARDTVERFGTPGPFYLKIWRANGRHTRTVFARGMAWVLEGWVPLVAAGEDWLLPRVRALVLGLLDEQRPDGAWEYLLDRPGSGPCNKGTPAIACHLQRAGHALPDLATRIGEAVERALAWCDEHMELAVDDPGHGGIFAHNTEGAISTVRDIPVAFNYASAYYILARREQES